MSARGPQHRRFDPPTMMGDLLSPREARLIRLRTVRLALYRASIAIGREDATLARHLDAGALAISELIAEETLPNRSQRTAR